MTAIRAERGISGLIRTEALQPSDTFSGEGFEIIRQFEAASKLTRLPHSEKASHNCKVQTITLGNINGHDVRTSYIVPISPFEHVLNPDAILPYDLNAPALRPAEGDGMGHLMPAPAIYKYAEMVKRAREGTWEHQEWFGHAPWERPHDAVPYRYESYEQGMRLDFLLYYPGQSGRGVDHIGIYNNHEKKLPISVYWIDGFGSLVVPRTIMSGKNEQLLHDEVMEAEDRIANPETIKELGFLRLVKPQIELVNGWYGEQQAQKELQQP
jgi:hypothetical protein